MGVYIKDMEMPNTCQICRAARLDRLINCEEFDRLSIAQRMYKRSETCPLVSVPAHGRLIDTDAFAVHKFICVEHDISNTDGGACYRKGWNDAVDAIMVNAPTVIPADTPKEETE